MGTKRKSGLPMTGRSSRTSVVQTAHEANQRAKAEIDPEDVAVKKGLLVRMGDGGQHKITAAIRHVLLRYDQGLLGGEEAREMLMMLGLQVPDFVWVARPFSSGQNSRVKISMAEYVAYLREREEIKQRVRDRATEEKEHISQEDLEARARQAARDYDTLQQGIRQAIARLRKGE